MLQLKDIKKDYKVGDGVVSALKGVNLAFRRNEFVSILGASGCGKTTLLNIIGGLDHYTSGDLVIDGVSTKDFKDGDWDTYRNHRIGFVFQSYNLIPHQTVLGNVELALTLSGVSAKERRERAKEALERVGLGSEINKRPNQLSGGQMQRVAIARALVNNPEILLADEPTGALDTNTSVQIMELIKEIAGERLVIMVTHNPDLAYKYSTRIVELKDGLVVNDSAPYSEEEEAAEVAAHIQQQRAAAMEEGTPSGSSTPNRKKKKSSMSFVTAFALSGKNLLTKKARTIITSIAGSIGIISVCLVLALSNGFNNYIKQTEEDMLSYYPVTVSETSLDLSSIMSSFMGGTGAVGDINENIDDKVYVNSLLSQLAQGLTTSNDLSEDNWVNIDGEKTTYIDYIESMPADLYYAIQYSYGVSISSNLFANVTIGSEATEMDPGDYNMSLDTLKEYYIYLLTSQPAASKYASLTSLVDYFTDVVSVMPDSEVSKEGFNWEDSYVYSQYDVIAGSLPASSDEIVLVVDSENNVLDLTLVQLGFLSEEQFLDLFLSSSESGETADMSIPVEDVLNMTYTLYYNDAVFTEDTTGTGYSYIYWGSNRSTDEVSSDEGRTLKISGILRLKDGLTYGCLEEGLCFTESLLEEYIAKNMDSQIISTLNEMTDVTALNTLAGYYSIAGLADANANGNYPSLTQMFSSSSTTVDTVIRELGGNDSPGGISIYARDFDSKDDMLSYLDGWNTYVAAARADYEANGANSVYADDDGIYTGPTEVTYTDTVGTLMSLVNTILNAVTYVLVAFTAISLVVSTVMIGVITYVSVVERIKEIGILRSIGARKKDIRHVFNAETFIVGLCAGLIGIVVAYLFQLIINAILTPLTGIANLAALPAWEALVMVCVSVVLTLISGLIPASAAAKKDPVIALRTE